MKNIKETAIAILLATAFIGYLYIAGRSINGIGDHLKRMHTDRELKRQMDKENWDKHE